MATRTRRPGGGRKPKGEYRGKSENFSTRISPDTRRALEREAAESGRSISQVAERLLNFAIQERRRRRAQPALRAISFLIEQAALGVTAGALIPRQNNPRDEEAIEKLRGEWKTDPFRYRAFESAVALLLSTFRPKGEVRSPLSAEEIDRDDGPPFNDPAVKELIKRMYASPENFGASIFTRLQRDLSRNDLSEFQVMLTEGNMLAMIRDDFYGMQQVRRDLGLDAKEGEK